MRPLAVTPILSPLGKLRAALEYVIPPRRREGDESMAAFVRRRLGREVFDRLVEPLVSAVYAADMERLSLEATLSQFREMELAHGSLIRAMRCRMKETRHRPKAGRATARRYSMFVTPREGLQSIVEAVAARLPPGSLRLDTPVERMELAEAGRWNLQLGGSRPAALESFDAVILSTPSHEAGGCRQSWLPHWGRIWRASNTPARRLSSSATGESRSSIRSTGWVSWCPP